MTREEIIEEMARAMKKARCERLGLPHHFDSNELIDNGDLVEAEAAYSVLDWRPIETAPKDGTLLLLLVDYSGDDADHNIDDREDGLSRTIGHNNDDNVLPGEGESWQFAGWCWTHDHYVEGRGRPIRWMHLPEPRATLQQDQG